MMMSTGLIARRLERTYFYAAREATPIDLRLGCDVPLATAEIALSTKLLIGQRPFTFAWAVSSSFTTHLTASLTIAAPHIFSYLPPPIASHGSQEWI